MSTPRDRRGTEGLDGPPEARPHRFLVLDGLRGVAALVVVAFHTGSSRFIPGGYLAVDLFFCLSGFVLAHAYATQSIGFWPFIRARLIRLYPLYLVGLIAGLILWPADLANALHGLLFLPAATEVSQVYRPYPYNVPAWSLLFEILVNLLWFPLRRMGSRRLARLALVALAFTAGATMISGSGDIGSTGPWFMIQGLCRVGFPFFLGVFLHRQWAAGGLRLGGPWWLSVFVMLAMFMLPGPRPVVDIISVAVLAPLIVSLGAAASAPPRAQGLCHVLGEASYPVYILHSAVLALLAPQIPELPNRSYFVAAAVIPLTLVVAWGALKFYDRPVRRFLSAIFL